MRTMIRIPAANDATAMITHHTSGNLVLWAWGDTTDDACTDPDSCDGLGGCDD